MTDKCEQAYQDYVNGMKYADISAKYDVSISAVKSWAARYWNKNKAATKNKKSQSKKEKLQPPPRKKGGQSGNVNTVKHGAYRKVFMDALCDDETDLIDDIATDDKTVLEQTIISLTIRERRLLKDVKRLKEESAGNKNLILGSVTKIHGTNIAGEEDKTVTVAEAVFTALRIYESELTKVQAQKAKLAVELNKALTEEESKLHTGKEINIKVEYI